MTQCSLNTFLLHRLIYLGQSKPAASEAPVASSNETKKVDDEEEKMEV